jgi:hypothetical protein
MTQSAGFRGRKMAASTMSKDDELYGSSVSDTNGEPVRNGTANRNADSQQSDTRLGNSARQLVNGRNR